MSRWEVCTAVVAAGAPLEDMSGARVTSLGLEVVRVRAQMVVHQNSNSDREQ